VSLDWKCELCGAKKGQPCVNTLRPSEPLVGRGEHFARVQPPGQLKVPEKRNEALYDAS
jgi:hypothetical protein